VVAALGEDVGGGALDDLATLLRGHAPPRPLARAACSRPRLLPRPARFRPRLLPRARRFRRRLLPRAPQSRPRLLSL
jgi:hypothetical protein